MGLYLIESEFDSNVYLGYALDLRAKINRHKAELRFGTHRVKQLQQLWNTHGTSALKFRIVDILEHDEKIIDPQKELQAFADLWQEKLIKEGKKVIRL